MTRWFDVKLLYQPLGPSLTGVSILLIWPITQQYSFAEKMLLNT